MTTENTLENKARFFALYWGQRVLIADSTIPNNLYPLSHWNTIYQHSHFKNSQLELTPLSQISDEDAIEVARVIWEGINDIHIKIHEGRLIVRDFEWDTGRFHPRRACDVHKYLISKGYYIGDGTEIEYGWVKLKGDNTCKP